MKLPAKVFFLVFFFLFFLNPNPLLAISAGDLVINEIMKNPAAVDDNFGEWFEIYNSTNQIVDLRGLQITDNTSNPFTVSGGQAVNIDPFGLFVFGRNSDSTLNGGLIVDYQYSSFLLNNTGPDQILITLNSVEIDKVEFDPARGFPNEVGASMMLLTPSLDNNLGSNWTSATTAYGDGDLGTPGEANFPSPTPTSTNTPTLTPILTPSPTPTLTPTPASTPPTPTSTPIPPPFPPRQFLKRILRRIFRFFPFSKHLQGEICRHLGGGCGG